jgi:hypothetical protein
MPKTPSGRGELGQETAWCVANFRKTLLEVAMLRHVSVWARKSSLTPSLAISSNSGKGSEEKSGNFFSLRHKNLRIVLSDLGRISGIFL